MIMPQMLWCETLNPGHIPQAKRDTLLRVANWNDVNQYSSLTTTQSLACL